MRTIKNLKWRFLLSMIGVACVMTSPLLLFADHLIKISWGQKKWVVPESLQIQVEDADGQLVPNAEIRFVLFGTSRGDDFCQETKADSQGQATIVFSPDLNGKVFTSAYLAVEADGLFLPYRHDWDEGTAAASEEVEIPEQFKATLEQGKMVRICVTDEAGNGIEGVKVQHWPFRDEDRAYHTDREGYYEFGPVKKDERYRNFDGLFLHENFQPLKYKKSGGGPDRASIYPKTVILKQGKEIFGTITDEHGEPVAEAVVHAWGNSSLAQGETQSDASGKYRLKGLADSEHLLIIRKPGWVLFGTQISAEKLDAQHDVTLKKGKTLRIKFDTTYPEDQRYFGIVPPPVVTENFTFWDNVHFSFQEEKNGTFDILEWNECPAEEQEYLFTVWSFASPVTHRDAGSFRSEKNSYRFRPREEPYVIKVLDVPRITIPQEEMPWPFYDDWTLPDNLHLAVWDENGKSLPDAKVRLHLEREGLRLSGTVFEKEFDTDAQGTIDFDLSDIDKREVRRVFITVTADNYEKEELKWYSDPIRGDRKIGDPLLPQMDIMLHPKGKTAGIVRDEDGHPIPGVKVSLKDIVNCTFEGKFHSRGGPEKEERITYTDSSGRWQFDLDCSKGYGAYELEKEGFIVPTRYVSFGIGKHENYPKKTIVTMNRAQKFAGKVVDPQGNPIKGASFLFLNGEIAKSRDFYRSATDENGRFLFDIATVANNNRAEVKILSTDRTPLELEMDLTKPTDDLTFVLKPGKDLKLQFVFEGENTPEKFPEFDVSMKIQRSKLPRLSRSYLNYFGGGITIQPDEQGKVVLKNVPDMEIEYKFLSKNGMFVSGEYMTDELTYHLQPTEDFQTITIKKTKFPVRILTGGSANDMAFSSYSSSWQYGRLEYQSSPKPIERH